MRKNHIKERFSIQPLEWPLMISNFVLRLSNNFFFAQARVLDPCLGIGGPSALGVNPERHLDNLPQGEGRGGGVA